MMQDDRVKITIVQYEIEQLPHWQAYEDKIVRIIEQAKEQDVNLLTMSEYAGLELASWNPNKLAQQFEHIQKLLGQYQQLFLALAQQYQLYIQPGSLPVKGKDGYYRNRAFLFSPDGKIAYQDKIFLTPFERKIQLFRPGTELNVVETSFGKIGITISYDCEFPLLAKRLVASGVNLILVPCCTEKFSGLTRVSISSRARAIENQCYVAQSCLIGKVSWCDIIDINAGQSGIYSPVDIGFPEDGILAQAQLNTPMSIHAELTWSKLEHARQHGEMSNFLDMQNNLNSILNATSTVSTI